MTSHSQKEAGSDACRKAIVVPIDHWALRSDAVAANCSIEACAYADFAGACVVAVGQRKAKAAAGASANMINAVKPAEDIGEVVVISNASIASAADAIGQVYEAALNLDCS